MAYKYKLSEMSKTASPKAAEEEFDSPYETLEVGKVTFSDDGTSKSTITNIDPVTGAVSWEITQLPGFEKLYDEMDDLVDVAKRVYVKTKDDKKFREFYESARKLRNAIRTHLRNEYPDQYKRIVSISEDEEKNIDVIDLAPTNNIKLKNFVQDPQTFAQAILDIVDEIMAAENDVNIKNPNIKQALGYLRREAEKEMKKKVKESDVDEVSMSGAAGAYLTPYAFRIPRKKRKKKKLNEAMDGGRLFDYFNKKYVVDDHFHSDDSYIVKREPSGKDQYVIFDYDKDTDQFQIRQMGGYRIDQEEAMKAGMRETSRLARAGMDAYMVDGNYSPTPISIKGLKDVVDHVMGGLSREASAQQDYYARRGPVSGIGSMDEALQLVHVYDKDGKMYGTGSVEKVEGDKTTVRFDGSTVKRFPSDRVKPVKEALKESNNPGATLGPGPAAGENGVVDSAYTKQFKYKLVPKTKDGTYVQKGSGLEVKKLF